MGSRPRRSRWAATCSKQSFDGADDGFKARFERANRDKELPGGRKIDFSACQDDGNNPQNNLQIVTKLTQQDEVFAIVGISADFLQPSADFLARNQVPFFGWGFVPGFCANRWAFGFNGCLVTEYPGAKQKVYQSNLALGPIEAAGLTPKTTKVALQAGDDDAGKSGNVTIGALYELEGADVVYNESNLPVPGPPASFTPFVEAVNAKDPNLLLTLTNFQTAPGFTAAMSASGYTGANVNFVGYVPGLLVLVGAAGLGARRRLRQLADRAAGGADARTSSRSRRTCRRSTPRPATSSPWPRPSPTCRPTSSSRS